MRLLYLFLFVVLMPALVACRAQTPSSAPPEDPAKKRLEMLEAQPLSVQSIFSGKSFPTVDVLNRDLVEAAVGPISEKVRFFDAQWNEVTKPTAPGRYGALVTFTAGGGLTWTHHTTLFKTPQPYYWPSDGYSFSLEFPHAFGIPPELVAREFWNVHTAAVRGFNDSQAWNDNQARLLAALNDLAADPKRWEGFSFYFIDRSWWAELGRHIGENQDYRYLTYTPPDYDKDPNKHWPLLLFLHGSGERGDDLQIVKHWGPITWTDQGHSVPMLIIEPQCPTDEWWDPVRLERLLEQVSVEKRVDPKRIYVTGLSMGGYGTCEFAALYPQRVAAMASLSGGENPALAPRLKTIPSWFFHGEEDPTVPPSMSIDLAHALQKLGAPAELTLYPGVGHGKWDVTYGNPALYSWFLSQSK